LRASAKPSALLQVAVEKFLHESSALRPLREAIWARRASLSDERCISMPASGRGAGGGWQRAWALRYER
jgi:hypothetical protein